MGISGWHLLEQQPEPNELDPSGEIGRAHV